MTPPALEQHPAPDVEADWRRVVPWSTARGFGVGLATGAAWGAAVMITIVSVDAAASAGGAEPAADAAGAVLSLIVFIGVAGALTGAAVGAAFGLVAGLVLGVVAWRWRRLTPMTACIAVSAAALLLLPAKVVSNTTLALHGGADDLLQLFVGNVGPAVVAGWFAWGHVRKLHRRAAAQPAPDTVGLDAR